MITEILSEDESKKRGALITHFISIAKQCRQFCSFNAAYLIVSALSHPSISRLKKSWKKVSNKNETTFAKLASEFDDKNDFKKFEQMTAVIEEQAAVPLLEHCLKKVELIENNNESKRTEKDINWSKMAALSQILIRLKKWQLLSYSFTIVNSLFCYISKALNEDYEESKLMELSISCEKESKKGFIKKK